MTEKQIIEIPVIGVQNVIVTADPLDDARITFVTESEADICLKLAPRVLAELEAMLVAASLEQAKKLPKQ